MKFDKICVMGLGYIGLPTACTFATHGAQVVGVDVNPRVLNTLRNGEMHIHEPGLRTLVQAALASGNLKISSTPEEAQAFMIAVPTPFYDDKRADLRAVIAAAEAIVPYLRAGNLVVLESTSPPRTTIDILVPILERSNLRAGKDFFLAYSPERVLPGRIIQELIENDRVIGGIDPASAEAGRDLYTLFVRAAIVLTDATTAEMVKLAENTYRDVNIAIANEFARLADRFGVDAWEVIALANRHPRVKILRPGPGVGGHCISVDPWFLVEAAPDLTPLVQTARRVNDSQPDYVVQLARRALAGDTDGLADLRGRRIAALGLAYKADVDDVRESPAIEVVNRLHDAGAIVTAYEPYKPNLSLPGITCSPNLEAAIIDAELIILLVAHRSFTGLDPARIAALTPARALLDTVDGWTAAPWEETGFRLTRLGVGVRKPISSEAV